jgi:hypothetical protein
MCVFFLRSRVDRCTTSAVKLPSWAPAVAVDIKSAGLVERGASESAMLRKSIQESFRKQEDFPISVILLDLLMPHQGKSGKLLAESIHMAQASDQVVLFCDKELSRWSRLETTNFDQKLESTIDFLSQLEDTDEYESATAPYSCELVLVSVFKASRYLS